MAELPAYHGRTHLPGGTDPINLPASDLTWCLASCSTATVSVAGSGTYYPFTFDGLYSNDTSAFEAVDVTTHRAAYIQVNTPGYYIWKAQIFKASGTFPSTNDTWIEPVVVIGGLLGNIQGNQGIADWLGAYYSAATRIKTGGDPHEQLVSDVTFNYDPNNPISDIDFENPLKIGLNLAESGGPASISMAASMFLLRVAAPGYTDLSPP